MLDQNEQITAGLRQLIGGLFVLSSTLFAIENIISHTFPLGSHVIKNPSAVSTNSKRFDFINDIRMKKQKIRDGDTSICSPLCSSLLPVFALRLEKISKMHSLETNNVMSWNEWARRNLVQARNICLEADYFYGTSNVLPKDWSNMVEQWESTSCGDCLIDDGSYKPIIFDETPITIPLTG